MSTLMSVGMGFEKEFLVLGVLAILRVLKFQVVLGINGEELATA
jgi:hypothetical protein